MSILHHIRDFLYRGISQMLLVQSETNIRQVLRANNFGKHLLEQIPLFHDGANTAESFILNPFWMAKTGGHLGPLFGWIGKDQDNEAVIPGLINHGKRTAITLLIQNACQVVTRNCTLQMHAISPTTIGYQGR